MAVPDFDLAAYKSNVLSKIGRGQAITRALDSVRSQTGKSYPPSLDLFAAYGVVLGMSDAQVADAVRQVRETWNSTKINSPTAKENAKTLALLDVELTKRFPGNVLLSEAGWRELEGLRLGSMGGETARLAAVLAAEYPGRTVLTQAALERILKSGQFGQLTDADVQAQLSKSALSIVPELVIPNRKDFTNLEKLVSEMNVAGAETLLELVFGTEFTSITVLGGMVGRDPKKKSGLVPESTTEFRITPELIRAAMDETTKTRGIESDARATALGVLQTQINSGRSIDDIALVQLIDTIAQQSGVYSQAVGRLTQFGLITLDAERIAAAASQGSSPASTRTAADVDTSIAEGDLGTAALIVAALPATEPRLDEVRKKVSELTQRRETLKATARAAIRDGDVEHALKALQDAASIDRVDQQITDALASLPPLPPILRVPAVLAQPGRSVPIVELTWGAPLGQAADTTYIIRRTTGDRALTPNDGVAIKVEGTGARDTAPPIAERVFYTAFAIRAGTPSQPTHQALMLTPAPANLASVTDGQKVDVSWNLPDLATGVAVTVGYPDGKVVPVAGTMRGVALSGLELGIGYDVSVVALYKGGSVKSDAATIRVVPSPPAKAVTSIQLKQVPGGRNLVTASWSRQEHHNIILRFASTEPPWSFGQEVPRAEADSYGQALSGAGHTDAGKQSSTTGEVPLGEIYVIPLTVTGIGTVLVGQLGHIATTVPPSDLTATRFGERIAVAWDWPDGVDEVQLSWRTRAGNGKTSFLREVVIRSGTGATLETGQGEVEVTAQSVVGHDRTLSAPVKLTVPGESAVIRYSIAWPKAAALLSRATRHLATVSIVSDSDVRDYPVVVIGKSGATIPFSPEGTQHLLATRVDLTAGVPATLAIDTTALQQPFWLVCFPGEDAEHALLSPPAITLKKG